DRVAETAAAGNVIDQQTSFRQRNALRNAGGQKRFAPLAGAHGRSRRMLAGAYFVEHFQTGLDDDASGADSCRKTAGQAEPSLGYAAIGLVVDAAILRSVDQIDAMAAESAAILTEATAVGIVRASEVKKRVLHFDALDVADSRGRNIHVSAGIDAITMGCGAHARTVNVVEPLRHGDAFTRMAAVKITRPANEFQIAGGRRVHVVVTARSVDHLCHRLAHGGNQDIADARTRAA